LVATHYKVCGEGMVDEQTPASVINPENLEQSFSHVKRLVSNQAEHIRHLLPPSLQKRLTAAEHVEARFLLNPPTKPWPATRQEQEASCEPIYVRPPVFVKARSAGSPLC
ncbi:MAG: hypothetical protein K9N51_06640, partial [Candidatus Pacebacteria bacterium]|nr:hypothetical protein [Candidatus Paceibacterota bacterium]